MRLPILALLALSMLSCATVMDNDAGTDTHDVAHADVRPDDVQRDDGPLDVIEDHARDVMNDLFDVPAPIDIAEISDVQVDDVPEDTRPGQDAMTCSCPTPPRDTTTFSIGALTLNNTTQLSARSDYSIAFASALHKLVNNQARVTWSFGASFYDSSGRSYNFVCSEILTTTAGVRVAGSGMCSFAVRDALDALVATTTSPSTSVELQNITDTSVDVVIPAMNANGTGGNFGFTNMRIRVFRPNGGLALPPAALTP